MRLGLWTAVVALGALAAGVSGPVAGAAADVPTCFGMPATIIGTAGDDVLTGTPADDVIVGLEGTDVISTSGGTDRVCAGPNELRLDANGVPRYERVTFGNRSGYVDGGPGLDRIETENVYVGGGQILGGTNPTVVDDEGRLWPERIVAYADDLDVSGGDGPDRVDVGLSAGMGVAEVDAGAGNDVVRCFGDDIGTSCAVSGGPGHDRLSITSVFTANLYGGSGNDRLSAHDFRIRMNGGSGNDVLIAESSDSDVLWGGPGRDRLLTYSGVNSPGPHVLHGGAGADRLVGHGMPEVLRGGPGSDTVWAGGGPDRASGGTGHDVLHGARGRDSLRGGPGRDANFGGRGSDLCRSPHHGPRAHSCER